MTIDIAKIADVIVEEFPQHFESAITRRSKLFNMFRRLPPSSAQGPRWQVKYEGHANVTSFSPGAAAPASDEFERIQATMGWAQYHGTLKMHGLTRDELEAAGDLYIDNYIAEQAIDLADEFVDTIEADLGSTGGTSSPGGNGVIGLATILADTGTYAGIARSGNTYWQVHTNDNSGTPRPLTMALMNSVHNALVDTIQGDYDAILTTKSLFDKYCSLSSGTGSPASNRLHLSPTDRQLTAVGGFGDVAWFNGRPILSIPGYTTGRMDYVTLDNLTMRLLKDLQSKVVATSNDDEEIYFTWKGQTEYRKPRFRAASLQDVE